MKLQVSGKLKTATAEQPSFKGFRIEALFGREPTPTPSSSSTSKPITAEVKVIGDATATPIELGSESAPDRIAAASPISTSAEAPIPFRVSTLSDHAGNFTLVLPDQHEITSRTVKLTVSLPTGRIIREMEVARVELGEPITIEVEPFHAGPSDEAPVEVNTLQSVAVDALFRTDAAFRRALTDNLKSLRRESETVAARVEMAWQLRPSQLSADELARRHYVAPGSDPDEALGRVIMSGVDLLRSAKNPRALKLRNTAEVRDLIKSNQEPGDSSQGVVELGTLIEFIQRRGAGPFVSAELSSTRYRAEVEADAILEAVANGDRGGDGDVATRREALASDARESQELVRNTVNMQMKSATAPEAQLTYSKIPNSADEDKAQKTILQSFELRQGPTDVTSYHDFHTLQIAFEHVWTEIFDGQVASLGRDLYSEYVKLKDFSGSTQPDLRVSTIADLRRLIEEIKKLSQFVEEEVPSRLRPEGEGKKTNDWIPDTPEDAGRIAGAIATGGASLFIEWAFNELMSLGNKPVIAKWKDFPLKLNPGRGNLIELLPPDLNIAYPGTVEIVLETDSNSFKKQLVFQQWDAGQQRPIYSAAVQNFGPGHGSERGASGTIIDRLLLNLSQIASGTIKFVSEDEIMNHVLLGRYVLGDLSEVLKDRTRVTFRWKGDR